MIRAACLAAAVLAAVIAASPARAVDPSEMLADPALEGRAREISKELRCLVCQNQSIDDSDADLARDLRRIVRERITAGDSNEEVIDYIVARYGDFVLLRPPFKNATLVLWLGPALIVVAGVIGLGVFFRRHARRAEAEPRPELNAEEAKRVADALGQGDDA